ncbi:undecaprenyl/decaprenyl-phosphate alpha-N-acetylglucosaminyl 1-phosphate transferase [Candidatus Woesebacteria bacterium]|nr:undecaprenyl/decaprenyl-phosphate alpha-N-acetylglucosaminyl 1-phosphate transferase [Candidatus Woesebacteria bacterium]
MGWVEDPNQLTHEKTTHEKPVPRGGGLVVAAGILAVVILFVPLTTPMIGVLLGALVLLISGTLDDRYDINPYIRYVLNILAAVIVIASGVGISFVTNPFGGGVINLDTWQTTLVVFNYQLTVSWIADGFALLWIVWNMNAVNWAKGLDGQLPGFVSIAALFIALLSLRFEADMTQGIVTLLALAVSGAYAGLLIWNFYPQKMMPGYAGGSLAGYFLAILAILSGAKIATVLLLLALPMTDAVYTVIRRLAAGKSPFWGDRGHLHHRMLDAGMSKRTISVFYMATTTLFGLLALQLSSTSKLYALLAAGILSLALILWFKRSITSSKLADRVSG